MKKVFILTEGGENIGFGHITRCTALCQAFEERGIIPKFIVNGDDSVIDLFANKNYEIFNWIGKKKRLLELIQNVDIAIIDSYLAEKDIYDRISDIVKVPVYLDDNKRLDYPKGIIVNGSVYAEELDYPPNTGITYLLGTKYTPLRKEFWEVPEKNIKEKVESVMVTFGGYDMRNMTPKILKMLIKKFPKLKKNVIIGKSFKNIEDIEKLKDKKTKLYYNANAETMKNIMLETDIAISAAGQTTYELARIGLPTILIKVAKNQDLNINGLINHKLCAYAGSWKDNNLLYSMLYSINRLKKIEIRQVMSKIGKRLIDGKGTNRVIIYNNF